MNNDDRETLATLLDQLWATRNGGQKACANLCPHQRELIAAAMRIVAGTTSPRIPDPWARQQRRWVDGDPLDPSATKTPDPEQRMAKFVSLPSWSETLKRIIGRNPKGTP